MPCVATYCVRDFASIQAAINAAATAGGGIVLFDAGTWRVNTMIELKSGVVLEGTARSGSILKAGTARITMIHAAAGVANAGLRNLTVNGGVSATSTALVGVHFDGATDCFAEQVDARNFGTGGHCFYMSNGAARNRWESCRGEAGAASSFMIYNTRSIGKPNTDNLVFDCEGSASANMGLEIRRSSRNRVIGCWFHDNAIAGINLEEASTGNIVSACRLSGNGAMGMLFTGARPPTQDWDNSGNVVEACVIADNRGPGIRVDSSSNNTISACDIFGNSHGVQLNWEAPASSYNRLSGCSIHDNALAGVSIEGVQGASVIGGQVRNNRQHGIRLEQSAHCIVNGVDVRSGRGFASDITEAEGCDSNTIMGCQAESIIRVGRRTRLVGNPGIPDV